MSGQKTTIDAFTYLKLRQIERDLERGYFGEFKFFLKYSSKHGINYALEWSAFHGKLDSVIQTVEHGADIRANNNVALEMATENNHLNVIKYLVALEEILTIKEKIIAMDERITKIEKFLSRPTTKK